MDFELGRSTLTVRGLHASPLCGEMDVDSNPEFVLEYDNLHDLNTIKVVNHACVFVGHIAQGQAGPFRSVIEQRKKHGIQVSATFARTDTEYVAKANGSRYQGKCAVISVRYAIRCSPELHQQKLDAITEAIDRRAIDFVAGEKPQFTASDTIAGCNEASNAIQAGSTIVAKCNNLEAECKRQTDKYDLLGQENKRLKIDIQ